MLAGGVSVVVMDIDMDEKIWNEKMRKSLRGGKLVDIEMDRSEHVLGILN